MLAGTRAAHAGRALAAATALTSTLARVAARLADAPGGGGAGAVALKLPAAELSLQSSTLAEARDRRRYIRQRRSTS